MCWGRGEEVRWLNMPVREVCYDAVGGLRTGTRGTIVETEGISTGKGMTSKRFVGKC